jgi:hypothetical protein
MINLHLGDSPILELDLLKKVEGWSTEKNEYIIKKFTIDPSFTFNEFPIKT